MGTDDGNGNADTIMVATYDVQEQTVGVVSVPRDTIVKQAGQGYPKINGVYAKGVDAMCTEVGKLLGIPIDYYLTVNLKGFVKLVDAVGGVDFNVPVDMDYDDPAQNLSIHYKKGVQHLNGQQALEVVRFRHNNIVTNNDYSDTERTQTQQKLVQAVMDKVISWGSIANIQQFLNICQSNIKTNLTANDWLYFAGQVLEMGADGTIITKTLSGRGDATHNRTKWCFELNKEQTLQDINDLLNPYTTPVTEEMANIIRANG